MKAKLIILLFSLCLTITICSFYLIIHSNIVETRKNSLFTRLQKKISWENKSDELDKPFIERISPCSDNDILKLITIISGDATKINSDQNLCKAGLMDEQVKSKFNDLFCLWPVQLQQIAETFVLQVFIVKNLMLSGVTISVGKNKFVIFIDERIFTESPNEWFNRTEALGYIFNKENIVLKSIIENNENQSPAFTLENILIHELGHCFGEIKRITPSIGGYMFLPNELSFFKGNYELEPVNLKLSSEMSKFDSFKVSYQNHTQIITKYIQLISDLKNSNFPTTYSIENYKEFFAEYFYSYIHCRIQKRPLKYKVFRNDTLIMSLDRQLCEELLVRNYNLIDSVFKN